MNTKEKLRFQNMKDVFQKDDGWNEETLKTIGLKGFLEMVTELDYEIQSCKRNTYAQFGDTGEDLVNYLIEIQETLETVIEEANFYLEKED